MTEAMVEALDRSDASPDFTPREQLALQFAELMAVNHKQIGDDFFAALTQEFSAAQIIELGMLIGVFILITEGTLEEILRSVKPSPIVLLSVADSDRSVILDQVTNGVAVRMAVLYLLHGGGERDVE